MKPPFLTTFLLLTVHPILHADEVFISEFLANQGPAGLEDASGVQQDWIEIHNPNPDPVDLSGYFLTDDPAILDKWAFPATEIQSDGYLIVFASATDPAALGETTELHANFRLNAENDNLILLKADGSTVLSEFGWTNTEPVPEGKLPRQLAGVSFGVVESLDTPQYLKIATPGAANENEVFLAEKIGFSEPSHAFTGMLTVELSSPNPALQIRFTLDGETPDDLTGTIYSEPIIVEVTTRVRARLEDPASNAVGAISGRHYLKLSDQTIPDALNAGAASLNDFTSNLPVIVLENYGGRKPTSSREASISLAVFEPGEDGVTRLKTAPTVSSRAIMRIRGKSSLNFPKKQWRVEIQNQEGDDKDVALLGLAADSDWILNAPWVDKAFIRNSLVYELGRDIGIYGMKTTPVEVFNNDDGGELNYEDDYAGVYVLTEPIRIAPHRIDLARLRESHDSEPEISGGYILKFDKSDSDSPSLSGWGNLQVHEPDSTVTRDQRTWASAYVKEFQRATRGSKSADPVEGWRALGDEQSFVNMMLINELTKEQDTYIFSHYLFKDRNRKLEFGPLWDYNLCFGAGISTLGTTQWNYKSRSSEGGWEARTFERDVEFRQLFIDDWTRLRRTILKQDHLFARIDRQAEPFRTPAGQTTGPAARNFAQWDILDDRRLNEFTSPRSETYEEQVDFIKDWLSKRMAWMDEQFTGAPELSGPSGAVAAGTEVALIGPDVIYFTTDGQDPRRPGGEVRDAAQMFPGTAPFDFSIFDLGSVWKYLDDGSDQGSSNAVGSDNWKHPDFDDSAWAQGPAELGYGDNNEATKVSFGDDSTKKHITTYFRTKFNLAAETVLTELSLNVQYDDGFVAYLNGVEVTRGTLPEGEITQQTLALDSRGGSEEKNVEPFAVDPGAIRAGENTIAVEIHQATQNNSDISFDLSITGKKLPDLEGNKITISDTTLVTARTKSGDAWSGPVFGNYLVNVDPATAGNLAISELMYHPSPRTQQELDLGIKDADHFEFIELANIGAKDVDLTGVSFTEGVSATIESGLLSTVAPGARVVLVSNREAFEHRYGTGVPIIGTYTGQLGNAGEKITLNNAAGAVIVSFTYDDNSPWPVEPDGSGRSLVLAGGSLDPTKAGNWTKSATDNGTPGFIEGAGASGFGDWLSATFTAEEIADPSISGPMADPDFDGTTNAFEFFFGTKPKDSSSSAEITTTVETSGASSFVLIRFDQAPQASSAQIRVEESMDLTNWIPSQAEISKADQSVEIRDLIVDGGPQKYLRIVVVID